MTLYRRKIYTVGIRGPWPSIRYTTRYGSMKLDFWPQFWPWPTYRGQGQRSRSRSHVMRLGLGFNMNLIWSLYVNYNWSYAEICVFGKLYDVIVTSYDVVQTKNLYRWNQWAKTFNLIYYSTWLNQVRFFRKLWPWANFSRSRSKVKVKVICDAPGNMLSYELNLKSLWQLHPKLWPIMWNWPFVWPWPWPLTFRGQNRTFSHVT